MSSLDKVATTKFGTKADKAFSFLQGQLLFCTARDHYGVATALSLKQCRKGANKGQ
eukprot:CAMPEP_0175126268 /NCGR_PEP_ID=MMETSP0087-20121206/3755_1 /TAXON_ID=136419 /ORGANISM="Unknown Unknown, Strain D1" /LENGTH=55 /DNA_ID=CAMNT_0016408153 /DNA_START=46 /DNA_END=213 /DNA_ORIENTATION=-